MTGLSRRLTGATMAKLGTLIRSAKSSARVAGRPVVLADLEAHLPGPALNPALIRRVAVHEAGHAAVAFLVQHGRVMRVSMSNEGGLTERTLHHSESLEANFDDHLAVHLAGRAAERVVLRTISAGAGGTKDSDLAMTMRLVTMIETQFGLGGSGPVWMQQTALRDSAMIGRIRTRLEAAEARLDGLLASLNSPARNTPACTSDSQNHPVAC